MDFHGENKAVKGTVRLHWAILNGVIREGLAEVTFESHLKGGKRARADVWGKSISDRGVVSVQALGQECVLQPGRGAPVWRS